MPHLRRFGWTLLHKQTFGSFSTIQRFVLIVLIISLAPFVPFVLASPDGSSSLLLRTLTALALVMLGWRWYRWSRHGRYHYADHALEAGAIVLAAIAIGDVFPMLGIIYTAFYYRALVGTPRFAISGAVTSVGALFAGAYFAGHATHTVLSGDLLGQLPTLALTAALGYVLSYVIQRQQRLASDLTEAEQRYRSLIEQLPEVVFTARLDGAITYVSPQVVDILGMPSELIIGMTLEDLEDHVDPRDRALFRDARVAALTHPGPFEMEYRMRTMNRGILWLRAEGRPISDENGVYTHWLGTISDITDRKGLEDQLTFQAFHDNLTNLPNRTLFRDRLEHALARGARANTSLAVLFLDLDNFKVVNDSLGHHAGDELIQTTAERLQTVVRKGDTVARIGGDEFVVLLEDITDEQEPIEIAERILEVLGAEILLKHQALNVSTSIGIVLNSGNETSAEDIIRHADLAMYAAKRSGRSQFTVYVPQMGDVAVERLEIETGLRRALRRNELVVHFQPVVDLRSGKITEVEGLVRWNHPERGLLLPGAFLDVAEETGLIRAIDLWVLRESCGQVRRWQQSNPRHAGLVASVNLSPSQLREAKLTEQVAEILEETGLQPRHLKLEITEHAMLADIQRARQALVQLGALGVRLAIDDFGTGNSALNYLREFPINTLKIDRSFVTGLQNGKGDSEMVEALITLAQSLGLDVTAEGIEGDEYLTLRRFGCDQGQGYHFARPQEAAAFEELLRQPPLDLSRSILLTTIAAD